MRRFRWFVVTGALGFLTACGSSDSEAGGDTAAEPESTTEAETSPGDSTGSSESGSLEGRGSDSEGSDSESTGGEPVWPDRDISEFPYETLSEYAFFVGGLAEQEPAYGTIPYTVSAPLWADDAYKGRFFTLPAGETVTVTEQAAWEFPVGTIFIKTFFFDTDRRQVGGETRIVETRLMVLYEEGWVPFIYKWNDDQTEATQIRAGDFVQIPYIDAQGREAEQSYIIPDEITCEACHSLDDVPVLLGPITEQMNTWVVDENGEAREQLDVLAEYGVFDEAPNAAQLPLFSRPDGEADVAARARAYLHGNCSHCHRPGGGGGSSGLSLLAWEDNPLDYGICKVPTAAGAGAGGRSYDIVPGQPEASIITFRMASEDPDIKMPELPSMLPDTFGVDLISEWIASMPESDCNTDE